MRNKRLIVFFCILAFVTLFIVLGSVVFSVQSVYAYCYNADDAELDAKVASREVNGIAKGKSIFMLNEDNVIKSVESNLGDVVVKNVERKFPNRVYINYVKVLPCLVYENGDVARIMSDTMRVMENDEYAGLVELRTDEEPIASEVGKDLFAKGGDTYAVVTTILETAERIYPKANLGEILAFIDVTHLASSDKIYVGTKRGAVIEIMGKDNLMVKLRLALSVADEKDYREGTIIVNRSAGGEIRAAHSTETRYPGRA